jgi:hypothetical protein
MTFSQFFEIFHSRASIRAIAHLPASTIHAMIFELRNATHTHTLFRRLGCAISLPIDYTSCTSCTVQYIGILLLYSSSCCLPCCQLFVLQPTHRDEEHRGSISIKAHKTYPRPSICLSTRIVPCLYIYLTIVRVPTI